MFRRSRPAATESWAIRTARYLDRNGMINRAKTGGRSRPPFCPAGTSQWAMVPGEFAQRREPRYEAEPASSGRSLPRPSMRRTQQWIQTTMQIYASAARLRSSGAHSYMRHESQRLWRATATSGRFLADRRSEAPVPPKANDLFLPVLILRYLIYFANLKPSGIT